MTATACVEVMPTGLSSTIQPCTSRFLNFCCFGPRCDGSPPSGDGESGSGVNVWPDIIRPSRRQGRVGLQVFAKASRSVLLRRIARRRGIEFQVQILG